ncbi:ABC-2 type transporter-domain-containing protein [Vararia minispora EC-137]|uniref:ABC-2 type transporter-domain-containing protein n=1 Tax=Vararia minispora EC-137 TaxID=1314806 RepID=A0ACB8QHX2_9AGAM|nr:ABC-2 type transporter-domain-containing protein [Vararia minispora EC-137]
MSDTPADTVTLREHSSREDVSPNHDHVDIAEAEAQFHALERRLTVESLKRSKSKLGEDAEKGFPEESAFNLREYLQSSNDAHQAAGIAHKHVGVVWQNLQVEIFGGLDFKAYITTFDVAVLRSGLTLFMWFWTLISAYFPKKNVPTTPIIHKESGVAKPGEMVLVLGCPGSGCSTFLKAIANQRGEYAEVSGDVRYAGIDAREMAKFYKGEVVYNEEDDIHIATLTVAQTLSFALSTKTPGPKNRLPGVSRKAFQQEVLQMLLKMLNIPHTANTLVGDEFVRGVSGGERKRVSISEMMATRARVQCWDNSTRGLDASTALDFVKGLRVMTDVLGQTTFVSLYQAGEGIYDLFDKVMVLDHGRQVYFGSPSAARGYFETLGFRSLPRQSTADYLTGCTDPNERQFAPGRDASNVPSTPEALEQAYLKSSFAADMFDELEKYVIKMETEKEDQEAFRKAVLDDKKRGVSKKSPYTLGYTGQIWALTKRQFQQRLQDRFQLITSFTLSTILALVLGGAYFSLPLTAQGAFTRGSVIFAAMLVSALDAFGELPTQITGRRILRKQASYCLYRPSALSLANTLADLPFSAVRLFIYDVIVYFMAGLVYNAGAFWTFHLINYLAFLSMQGFFRVFGQLCSNFDQAFRLGSFFVPNIIFYVGYMVPIQKMKRWLFWIFYIDPMQYAYSALMENEFGRISFECDGNYVVPRNGNGVTKYPLTIGPNQVCTLFGATQGSSIISGKDYLNTGYSYSTADLWRRNFLVLIGWIIFFMVFQIIALDYLQPAPPSSSFRTFAKPNKETRKLNEELRRRKEEKLALNEKEKTALMDSKVARDTSTFADRQTFTWEGINYFVPVAGGQLQLLHDVYGYVKPGTLTALMGASGAGKTTCLDVLAQRKNIGVVSGNMLVDGRPIGQDFARGTAYAEQQDVHEGTATVREAMRFSAYLRQPASVSKEDKDAYVEEMIELLELQDLADAIVYSLGVEARKRLTIGVELASKPELLLFLDEPTSGLDAQSAWNLVRFLRKLADQGQAILCTIHQPSSLLFESFDRLLLLERGGYTVYFGDIGADSHVLRSYLARHGAQCPPNVNPAEYMLDAIGAGIAPRIGDRDWAEIWLDSPEYKKTIEEIDTIKQRGLSRPADNQVHTLTYATPYWYQLQVVAKRTAVAFWRSPDYVFTRLFVHLFISLFVSLPFLQLGHSSRDLQYRVFSLFWVTVLPAILMNQIEPMFILNRRIFIREASSRIYSPEVFALSQLLGEMPYSTLCAIVYWVLMVYPQHFGQGSAGLNGTGFQLLVILFVEYFGVTLGQVIAVLTPSIQVAVLFNPFIMVVLTTFCGVTIPYPSMISFWRSWLYELNPFTRVLAASLSTELHGLEIRCQSDEFAVFPPPTDQTCQDWAGDFVTAFGGYLDNPNDTSSCRYCQYKVGDEFYTQLNISYDNRWRDVWIIFAFFVFNFIVVVVASRYLRYARR